MDEPLRKRYQIFAFSRHYPKGGMDDIKGEADTEEQAFEMAKNLSYCDCVQVLDCVQRCLIWEKT